MNIKRTELFYQEMLRSFQNKTKIRNVMHRIKVLKDCAKSESARQDNFVMCSRDPLYWMNTFGFLEEPRLTSSAFGKIPLITFDFQDDLARKIMDCIQPQKSLSTDDVKDMWILKCRDMGVSWICIYSFLHSWIFRRDNSFAFLSYKRDMVDKKGDKGTLFSKIKFILDSLPGWMLPNYEYKGTTLENLDSNNTIISEATIKNAFRGNRMSGLFCDEFPACPPNMQEEIMSATQQACSYRIFNGTPQIKDIFWDRSQNPKGADEVVKLYWWLDPRKTKGLYTNYKGEKRSKWYDREEGRSSSKAYFDREVNLKPIGDSDAFFPEEMVRQYVSRCKDPVWVGELKRDGFESNPRGSLRMWIDPFEMRPDDYTLGVDISQGTGNSNSVVSVFRNKDRIKVAAYENKIIDPTDFASLVNVIGRKFCDKFNNPALVNFDSGGAGGGASFIRRLKDHAYPNIYRRVKSEKYSDETTEQLGCALNLQGKHKVLSKYLNFVQKNWIVNPDLPAVNEMFHFYRKITRSGLETAEFMLPGGTDASTKDEHGDRVIADSLAIYCLPIPQIELESVEQSQEDWWSKVRERFGSPAAKPGGYHPIATTFHKV